MPSRPSRNPSSRNGLSFKQQVAMTILVHHDTHRHAFRFRFSACGRFGCGQRTPNQGRSPASMRGLRDVLALHIVIQNARQVVSRNSPRIRSAAQRNIPRRIEAPGCRAGTGPCQIACQYFEHACPTGIAASNGRRESILIVAFCAIRASQIEIALATDPDQTLRWHAQPRRTHVGLDPRHQHVVVHAAAQCGTRRAGKHQRNSRHASSSSNRSRRAIKL